MGFEREKKRCAIFGKMFLEKKIHLEQELLNYFFKCMEKNYYQN